ncbi:MAG: hypothetical protein KAH67_00550, partial [Flavobacteriaceae bacterium]|nr:hypothetical protein [Flavobacteriaceae bacterium]
MYKFTIFFIVLITTIFSVFGQQKELTLSESILGSRSELAPSKLSGLQWIPETDTYCMIEGNKLVSSS